jgi:hypothetical protein
MPTAKISIVLEYDLDNHFEDEPYSQYTTDEIINHLEDSVYEDLIDLMRGDVLRSWSYYEIIDETKGK